jgi:hypothetical protein
MKTRISISVTLCLLACSILYAGNHENVNPISSFSRSWGDGNDFLAQGDYLYCGTSTGLQILDVSHPENPLLVGSLAIGSINGLCLADTIACAAGNYDYPWSEAGGFLALIDISDPGKPALVSRIETAKGTFCVERQGNFAFIGAYGAMYVVDISNPQRPSIVSEFDDVGEIFSICLAGDVAYLCGDWERSGLISVDISNPQAPRRISTAALNHFGMDAKLYGDYLLVADSYYNKSTEGTIRIFDVSNPANVDSVGEIEAATLNVPIVGDRMFVLNGGYSLQVYDLSNLPEVNLIGECEVHGEIMTFDASGNFAYLPRQGFEQSFTSIEVMDVSNLGNMSRVTDYGVCQMVGTMAIGGHYAYTNLGKVFDISDPRAVREFSAFPSEGSVQNMTISGDLLFITRNEGVDILNIANPADVNLLSQLDLNAYRSYPLDGYLYVRSEGDILIFDITDAANPQQVESLDLNLYINDVAIEGDYTYLANLDSGLVIYDISNPQDPRPAAHFSTGSSLTGVAVGAERACLSDGRILDVSDLNNIHQIGTCEEFYSSRDIIVEGDYLFGKDYSPDALRVFNISDPTDVREVGFYQPSSYSYNNIQIVDALLYLPTSDGIDVCRFEEGGYFTVTPANHDFGYVTFGDKPELTVNIRNTGNRSQSITNLACDSSGFNVHLPEQIELQPGGQYQATVTFDPADDGPYSSVLSITSDNPGGYVRQVKFRAKSIRGKQFDGFGQISDVQLGDGYAYLLEADSLLRIVDVGNPLEPAQVGILHDLTRCQQIFYQDGFVYASRIATNAGVDRWAVLSVVDVTDPRNPRLRGTTRFYNTGPATDLAVYGEYAFMPAIGAIYSYNLHNPDAPQVMGMTELGFGLDFDMKLQVYGPYLYAVQSFEYGQYEKRIRVFNLSYSPGILNDLELERAPRDIFVNNGYSYVIDNGGFLNVIDVSNAGNPIVSNVGGMSDLREVVVQGDYAFAQGDDYIHAIDITDSDHPVIAEDIYAPNACGVLASDHFLYVPAAYNGMFILNQSGAWGVDPDKGKNIPETMTLYHAYPNPFNSTTRISYYLPTAGHITMKIYDVSGRAVETLVDGYVKAGRGMALWHASAAASGVYLVRMEAGGTEISEKVTLIR